MLLQVVFYIDNGMKVKKDSGCSLKFNRIDENRLYNGSDVYCIVINVSGK